MQKGKVFFNIIIAISVVALICILSYVAYYYISNYLDLKSAEEAVDEFENEVIVVNIEDDENTDQIAQEENEIVQNNSSSNKTTSSSKTNVTHRGYSVIGTIQIPKTKDNISPSFIFHFEVILNNFS